MQPINDNRIISMPTLSYAIAVVLCTLTLLFFIYVPQSQPTGDELLKNTHFNNQLDDWIITGKGIQLANKEYKKTILIGSKSSTQSLSNSQPLKESELSEIVIYNVLS